MGLYTVLLLILFFLYARVSRKHLFYIKLRRTHKENNCMQLNIYVLDKVYVFTDGVIKVEQNNKKAS